MIKVRCKFRLAEKTEYSHKGASRMVFRPEYDTSIPEDARFAKASPSGEFTIYVDNPSAIEFFKVGEYYYFDAIPVIPPVEVAYTKEQPAAGGG